jgi:acetylglutamate kinase
VVHGGGDAISETMKKSGLNPQFVDGLRVTDSQTILIVENVLLETNKQIVDYITKQGGKAIGFSGKELVRARKRYYEKDNPGTEKKEKIDIGYVGEIEKMDCGKMEIYMRDGLIPVISPLGKGVGEDVYNINADSVAAEVAIALDAEKLVLLTDVKGIMRDPGSEESLIPTLKVSDMKNLMEEGVITGGMIPKVRACEKALSGGVRKTHIVSGRMTHSLLLEMFTEEGVGTEITK